MVGVGNRRPGIEHPVGPVRDRRQRPLLRGREASRPERARDLTAIWRTDLSVLYGRGSGIPNSEITLFCEDETDGFLGNEWGSDDIAVELVADESLTIKISNDQVGDFDDDDSRTLDPWITSITYVDKIDVTIIELDDTSANDRASATLLGADQLAGSPNFKILREEPGGVVHGELWGSTSEMGTTG
jgi:hypothetical protein